MATIAKGMITLTTVNDPYSVLLSPSSCVIHADFDGSNPQLDHAYTDVRVSRGDVPVSFTMQLYRTSNPRIKYDIIPGDDFTQRIKLTGLSTDVLSGFLEFQLQSKEDYTAHVTFQFSVVRESTMLDWIQDWESNKTSIGSTYLITPRIFIGKRIETSEDMNALTGVYLGPDEKSAGLYGYNAGKEIFYINESGGSIGGWIFTENSLQTTDRCFRLLSEGSIEAKSNNDSLLWGVYKSGEAVFAKGNVQFHGDGSALFQGKLTSSEGEIGGWKIGRNKIYSSHILMDSSTDYIGICAADEVDGSGGYAEHFSQVTRTGGICIRYGSKNVYGIEGYMSEEKVGSYYLARKIFMLGSDNYIAGWNFDTNALWLGTKVNTAGLYTTNANSLTIGTEGLRGNGWYIDTNGDVSFVKGLLSFTSDSGTLLGWNMSAQRLSTTHVALVSEENMCGLYLSGMNISDLPSASLVSAISSSGGICLRYWDNQAQLVGYDREAHVLFSLLSKDDSQIAGWHFNHKALFTGIQKDSGFTDQSGDITVGKNGLHGYKWRFEADGSGAVAGGNISWDAAGSVIFREDSSVSWVIPGISNKLTRIDGNGIYTGTISADNITAGTISTADIRNGNGAWMLNQDGSGRLASGNISWGPNGDVGITGVITATSGKIGGWRITETSIVSEEYSDTKNNVVGTNTTSLNQNGSFDGNLFKLDYSRNGYIRNNLWDAPILDWQSRYLKIHARLAIPFEITSAIIQGSDTLAVDVLYGKMETNNLIVEPSTDTVYYYLPHNLDKYNGVTLRIFNPATRSGGWIAQSAFLVYDCYGDRITDVNVHPLTRFLGRYTGTKLLIPSGRMAIITGVREQVAGGVFGQDLLKWYVELAP